MDDSFNFGKPAKRGPQINLSPRLVMALAALAVASLLVFFGMKFFASSGEEIGQAEVSVVQQVDVAQDVVPQSNLHAAVAAAQTAFIENNSYADAGPAQLAAIEPTFQYTDGPSTAPTILSISATEGQWSAAAMAESGTCFWISVSESTGTVYGSGTPCTGFAAAASADATW
jgi:hypothetical protein